MLPRIAQPVLSRSSIKKLSESSMNFAKQSSNAAEYVNDPLKRGITSLINKTPVSPYVKEFTPYAYNIGKAGIRTGIAAPIIAEKYLETNPVAFSNNPYLTYVPENPYDGGRHKSKRRTLRRHNLRRRKTRKFKPRRRK